MAVVVNIGLNLALVRVLGAGGLALATAISCWVGAFLLIWALYRRIPRFSKVAGPGLWAEIVKCFIGTIVMALGVSHTWGYLSKYLDGGPREIIIGLALCVAAGVLIYSICAIALNVADLHFAWSAVTGAAARIKSRLARSPARG